MKSHARVVVLGGGIFGAHGHSTGKTLAFAYVEPTSLKPGTLLRVTMLGEDFAATPLEAPIYDPANAKLRG